ncbi:CDP-glucose 4,6-dehydratase [Sediminibacterium roseum]|uniref:CDP-glucose 4,6-dehydratase n=1 Tax=Sediminibacterium roseum TaxID=1978412 RepID=A0ABW9ZSQ4_9BACT|nr:CDP-glucose 4,6-dehydratase [Sediminibacterium roseum]NCI49093.1 CDP-glucose 4,6-dehydratase [Sediminibacterium roseum]
MNELEKIFKGKVVVITGHTGFKGSWLSLWLHSLGASVVGLANGVPGNPAHFDVIGLHKDIKDTRADVRCAKDVEKIIVDAQPDFVFHLAAQALVRDSYTNPAETWDTNVMGTLHVMEALRKLDKKCVAVMITSDKCYDNVEWIWGYRETDALGGPDPYSASKGAAELVIKSQIKSFFSHKDNKVIIASARAGNVIGGGDWAENRIVPDCVKAWSKDQTVELRNPSATRPWQLVLEPLSGYLTLAAAMWGNAALHGEAFNFGPSILQNHSVGDLVDHMATFWKQVKWKDISQSHEGPYESTLLKLNCDKALHHLKWWAALGFEDTVKFTSEWYKAFYENAKDIRQVSLDQIKLYSSTAKQMGLLWAQ